MKDAKVYQLSRTLTLLVMPDRTAKLIRNDSRVFTLSDRELSRLVAELVIPAASPQPQTPSPMVKS